MGGDGRLTDEPRIKVSSKERWLTANNFQHSRGLIKESNGNERKNTETPALDGKTNRKQMVGRGVHFLWRGSFTRRIISLGSTRATSPGRRTNTHEIIQFLAQLSNAVLVFSRFPLPSLFISLLILRNRNRMETAG